jgi:hypothetical protein
MGGRDESKVPVALWDVPVNSSISYWVKPIDRNLSFRGNLRHNESEI